MECSAHGVVWCGSFDWCWQSDAMCLVCTQSKHTGRTEKSREERSDEQGDAVIYWVHRIPGLIVAQITRAAILRKQRDWFMMVAAVAPHSTLWWDMGCVLLLLYCLPWDIFQELIIYHGRMCGTKHKLSLPPSLS